MRKIKWSLAFIHLLQYSEKIVGQFMYDYQAIVNFSKFTKIFIINERSLNLSRIGINKDHIIDCLPIEMILYSP